MKARDPKHSSSYYKQIRHIIRVNGITLPPTVAIAGALVRSGVIDHRFYAGDIFYFLIATGFVVGTICFALYPPQNWRIYLLYTSGFHILAALFLLFVSGMLSPFVILWIILFAGADVYFGTVSLTISMALLLVTLGLFFLMHPGLSVTDKTTAVLITAAVVVTCITFSRLHRVSDRERDALERTHQQESFQRERLLALVNSMGDAVIATDEDGVINVFNAAALSLLDTNVSLMGKSISKVLPLYTAEHKKLAILHQAAEEHRGFTRTDLSYKFPDDEIIRLYINVSPIQMGYPVNSEKGYIFILRDITKEKSLEEERDEFISVVSHELRTPVAIAEGNISNIKLLQNRGASPTMISDALNDAHEQILYLSKMINDLSTLSRAERGLDVNVEEVTPADLATELYKEYLPQAQKQGLTLDLHVASHVPILMTNKLYLQEIIQNLITNALKYTKSGGITLQVTKEKDGIGFAVSDTGIGISKSDQKHIFEKFYRSEDYRTRESSGTGLGLYVSQKLADKMGFVITFTSRLNHGSTFHFVVPQSALTPAEPAAEIPPKTHRK